MGQRLTAKGILVNSSPSALLPIKLVLKNRIFRLLIEKVSGWKLSNWEHNYELNTITGHCVIDIVIKVLRIFHK